MNWKTIVVFFIKVGPLSFISSGGSSQIQVPKSQEWRTGYAYMYSTLLTVTHRCLGHFNISPNSKGIKVRELEKHL